MSPRIRHNLTEPAPSDPADYAGEVAGYKPTSPNVRTSQDTEYIPPTGQQRAFASRSKFDTNTFRSKVCLLLESLYGQKLMAINAYVFTHTNHEFNVREVIPLPDDLGTISMPRWEPYTGKCKGSGYKLSDGGIEVGDVTIGNVVISPAYVAGIEWGDGSINRCGYIPIDLKDNLIEALADASCQKLPYSIDAFPDHAVTWANKIKKFFSSQTKEKLQLHMVAQQSGVVLAGPPGAGKTMFVHYLESELTLDHVRYDPSELVQFASNGGSIPSRGIIVLDDVEELLSERSDGESTNILPWLLSQSDAHDIHTSRLLVMVTNHPEKLDDALLRPGRFDTMLKFGRPNIKQIRAALQFHMCNDYDEELVNKLSDKIKDKNFTMSHVSMVARLYYSEFAESWDEAVDMITELSGYRGIKKTENRRSMGFSY